ncbi:hypothetical protein EON80_08970 [bacterium]|nr:MAG: hypothetical protein EON80_08970 [bacterium]
MTSNFSRLVGLSLLVTVAVPTRAQPNIAPPQIAQGPNFKLTDSNVEAIALIGGFFNKMSRAESYRGRVTTTKSALKEGKVISTKSSTVESGWVRDIQKEDGLSKHFSKLVYTLTVDGKTTTEVLNSLDDGTKEYRFYGTKNVWSERPRSADLAVPLVLTRVAWMFALTYFALGNELKIERKVVDGQNQILVGNGLNVLYIFDAESGNLQSFTLKSNDESTEIRWVQTEFDVALPDSAFQWKAPEGSTQVAPESVSVDVQL